MKKGNDITKEYVVKEVKHYLGILNEKHSDDIKLLREHMDMRFEKVERTLNTHTEMIGNLSEDVTEIKDRLDKKDREYVNLEKRTRVLERKTA